MVCFFFSSCSIPENGKYDLLTFLYYTHQMMASGANPRDKQQTHLGLDEWHLCFLILVFITLLKCGTHNNKNRNQY